MQIAFIGEYLLSFPGGGERSIHEELKSISRRHTVRAITYDRLYKTGKHNVPYTVQNYGLKHHFSFSRFIELSMNETYVLSMLEKELKYLKECDYVLIQTLLAPLAAEFLRAHNIPYHYYLRDELNLNIFENYERGIRRALKYAKLAVEYMSIRTYKKRNQAAIRHAAQVICNSRWMQRTLFEKFGQTGTVQLPKIDLGPFTKKKLNPVNQKYITFIGAGNAMKGYALALQIARALPKHKFLFVGKLSRSTKNITYIPPQKNILDVYEKTKLLIVPSTWNEAYGRIVIEAQALNIPVITSDRGGLPEASHSPHRIIAHDAPLSTWVAKIQEILE